MTLLTRYIRHCLILISIADKQSQIIFLIMKLVCALFDLRTTPACMSRCVANALYGLDSTRQPRLLTYATDRRELT